MDLSSFSIPSLESRFSTLTHKNSVESNPTPYIFKEEIKVSFLLSHPHFLNSPQYINPLKFIRPVYRQKWEGTHFPPPPSPFWKLAPERRPIKIQLSRVFSLHCLLFPPDAKVKGVFRGRLCTRWLHSHFSRGSYHPPPPKYSRPALSLLVLAALAFIQSSLSFPLPYPPTPGRAGQVFQPPCLIILCKHTPFFFRIPVSRRRRANTWAPAFHDLTARRRVNNHSFA